MKRTAIALIVILAVAGIAAAQVTSPTQDVLGAHNVYGRGCIACHAPHSGAAGNGGQSSANSGNFALWGEDMSPLYGQTLNFGNSRQLCGYTAELRTGGYPSSPGRRLLRSLSPA